MSPNYILSDTREFFLDTSIWNNRSQFYIHGANINSPTKEVVQAHGFAHMQKYQQQLV